MSSKNEPSPKRAFMGVMFNCCRIYARAYRCADGTRYTGRCPRCGKSVRFRVEPGGQEGRFWQTH